jgi:hypothetical protein
MKKLIVFVIFVSLSVTAFARTGEVKTYTFPIDSMMFHLEKLMGSECLSGVSVDRVKCLSDEDSLVISTLISSSEYLHTNYYTYLNASIKRSNDKMVTVVTRYEYSSSNPYKSFLQIVGIGICVILWLACWIFLIKCTTNQ